MADMSAFIWVPAAAMLLALLIDALFGEPPSRLHPVVAMGWWLRIAGSCFKGLPPPVAFVAGTIGWCIGALVVVWIAWELQMAMLRNWQPWAVALLSGLLLKPLLAWRMLKTEVTQVQAALAHSLDAGRQRLAWLVSRDVTPLEADHVRESAIESLAENLNDSVVAPLFWFALFGLPGAALYRYANTADAMWGYPGIRNGQDWQWAGKWAARVDDVLGWVPARLTAFGIRMVAGGMSWPAGALAQEASRTTSPNSGWPMAAMALALGCRLRKPGMYALNGAAPSPVAQDVVRAIAIASRALWFCTVLLAVLALLVAGATA